MSYSYHPVAMFGVRFQKAREYYEFLNTHTKLAQMNNVTEVEDIDDLYDILEEQLKPLKVARLNMFSTQEAILGFPMTLGETVEKYQTLWNETFPNTSLQPEPILAIRLA